MKQILPIFIASFIGLFVSCSDSFLEPKPLSFFTAEAGLTDAKSMYAALGASTTRIRDLFIDVTFAPPMMTEYLFTEVLIDGTTDKTFPTRDMNRLVVPDGVLNDPSYNRIADVWKYSYEGIKAASIVITNIGLLKSSTEAERNAVLGTAYFHRAYWYYGLVNRFGDVPWVGSQIKEPKLNFQSTKRDVILNKIKEDMKFAVQWVPVSADKGKISRGACNHLLAQICLATGDFDGALTAANAVINDGGFKLMKNRFGVDRALINKNIIWDLHRPDNKSTPENTEGILNVIDRYGMIDNLKTGFQSMYTFTPCWGNTTNAIMTPAGNPGMDDVYNKDIPNVLLATIGRGVNKARGTNYHTYDIWDDSKDLRHTFDNWYRMEDLYYNKKALEGKDPYYMKPVRKYDDNGKLLVQDTIRNWCGGWPHYKWFNSDPYRTRPYGGNMDWYIYRLAETYLIRAEAYYWKGDVSSAMADVNTIRTRAECDPYIDISKFNLGTILDERARELHYEEARKCELTRIAFLYAKTGKPCYNGKTYSINSFSKNNFWYDRMMEKTDLFNTGATTVAGDLFTCSPYHVLWPVPQSVIDANSLNVINQNEGYQGFEKNIAPLDKIEDQ